MKASELYQSITQKIIADLENGVASWTKPWKNIRQTGIMPTNGATNRPYSGANVLLLWSERLDKGYPSANWLTFLQAQKLGGQVRKGEKSTPVFFTKKLSVKDKQTEEEKRVQMLRVFAVFNEGQIDGLPAREADILPPVDPIPAVEAFIKATEADIRIGGNRAFYDPNWDRIHLPDPAQFKSVEHFYATNLHELVHFTADKRRLDRNLRGRFGTKDYAAEELIAELGAAFLCGHLNIQGELKHAEYIKTWIQLLKDDDRAIMTAASLASKAAEYLKAFSEPKQQEEAA